MFANPRFWLGAVSALGVSLVVIKDTQRKAPGDLTGVHQREADLVGRNSCVLCHGDGEVRMADACMECHADVRAHIDGSLGLHGSLQPNLARECALCHSDHHGADFPVVNGRSFHIAGVPEVEEFDHETVGFVMEGMHLDLSCVDCHANVQDDVLPEGSKRYMGLSQDCATCHVNPHESRLRQSCADCHTQQDFAEIAGFDHGERFPLTGSHGQASCVDCHAEDSVHSIDAVGALRATPEWRECIDCHESPHTESFIESIAQDASTTSGDSCRVCHILEHEAFDTNEVALSDDQHALTGFPLELPHAEVECSKCHGQKVRGSDFVDRYPGRSASACEACHEDAHRGFFDARSEKLGLDEPAGCAECHLPHTFSDIPLDDFDHGIWAAFPLLGAHRQNACKSCHSPAPAPDSAGRKFGWAAEPVGSVEDCGTCHTDPHAGEFDQEGLPANLNGRVSCARCHDEVSFRSAPHGFDHGLWTGFALDGAHGEASCSTCHDRVKGEPFGRTWARAAGQNCADCHSDSHAGQFDVEGVTDCRRCHEDTNSFNTLRFDHDLDTRFPLDGTHQTLSCSECHRETKPAGVALVRYRPMGRECVDCHGGTRNRVRTRGNDR